MVKVCESHVKDGISILETPHICMKALNEGCNFCNNVAEFELDEGIPLEES